MLIQQTTLDENDNPTRSTVDEVQPGTVLYDFLLAHAGGGQITGVIVEFTDGSAIVYNEVGENEPATVHPPKRHLRAV